MAGNVVDMLRKIREGTLAARQIPVDQRRLCVAYLRLEGYTQEEIAEIFKVSRQTIIRDQKANRREAARLVDEINVKSIAGEHITAARHFIAKAIRDKDYALAWRINRELIADLQSLGYLPRSPEEHRIQIGTFVDLVEMAAKHVEAEAIETKAHNGKELPPAPDSSSREAYQCPGTGFQVTLPKSHP
ncbi:MAG: helix-turn-helix domain-containing protein [Planctomycetota bacterium]|jgi:predicted transcriptional regulator